MIRSFRFRDTGSLFKGHRAGRFHSIKAVARRKLRILDAAAILDHLMVPADNRLGIGNRLEMLKGDRRGENSIRINDQFRICFISTQAGPESVEIIDYD